MPKTIKDGEIVEAKFDPLKGYFSKYRFCSHGKNIIPNDVLTDAFEEMQKIVSEDKRKQVDWEYSSGATGGGWRDLAFIKWTYKPIFPYQSDNRESTDA